MLVYIGIFHACTFNYISMVRLIICFWAVVLHTACLLGLVGYYGTKNGLPWGNGQKVANSAAMCFFTDKKHRS